MYKKNALHKIDVVLDERGLLQGLLLSDSNSSEFFSSYELQLY